MVQILYEIFTEYALKMNQSKTETLILNHGLGKKEAEKYPKSFVEVDGERSKIRQIFAIWGLHLIDCWCSTVCIPGG